MFKNQISIVIGYPPINSPKGTPLLSQNRQFQYFHSPSYIYPMVPAYAASNLQAHGIKVYWLDGIAEKMTYNQWFIKLKKIRPSYLMIETKTPVIKTHWRIINDIKKQVLEIGPPAGGWKLGIILVGDHVTFLPTESFEKSVVDYVITGGDYDFVIVNLLEHIYKNKLLEGGVYWRKNNKKIKAKPKGKMSLPDGQEIYHSGQTSLKHDLNSLPFIDRDLTKWELYAYENGNYKYRPGTYMYSGRDCWWGKCTFCIWNQTLNPRGSYRTFSPERLFAEVKHVVDRYHVKEIFDDAGTMFVGQKLKKFCQLLIESGYNKKIKYSCNMRFRALDKDDYKFMAKAGFRFILFGMESASQKTLDHLNKGITLKDILETAKVASEAGLEVHATIMLGYPWETLEDIQKTIKFVRYCFQKGFFNSIQATIVIPYPGTALYRECQENDLLLTEDYDCYDMREPVIKTPFPEKQLFNLIQKLYISFLSPQYILRKILSIRNFDDIKFFCIAGKKLFGHLIDFYMVK